MMRVLIRKISTDVIIMLSTEEWIRVGKCQQCFFVKQSDTWQTWHRLLWCVLLFELINYWSWRTIGVMLFCATQSPNGAQAELQRRRCRCIVLPTFRIIGLCPQSSQCCRKTGNSPVPDFYLDYWDMLHHQQKLTFSRLGPSRFSCRLIVSASCFFLYCYSKTEVALVMTTTVVMM